MPENLEEGSIPFTDAASSRRPARQTGKNIVLCAYGTGNIGGETPDSNVYRVYKMVELHDAEIEQVKFYDNGVGTAKNKYWRAISGAFGGGFKSNVCDLYQFLARSYDPGDRIYLFGFSRGAATVRAFSGFIATCGLVDGRDLSQEALRKRTEEAYDAYKAACGPKKPEKAEKLRQARPGISHGVPPVEALCVWDSVAALGLPQNFKVLGLVIWFVNFLFAMLEKLVDWILPHRFHNYELTDNVRHAYHAIAIDDERLTFQPMVWDEHRSPNTRVEQVWFAGAHSNVGGGYARNGLSSVALLWMMLRVERLGLHFEDGALREAADDVNEHGRLFDSRDGLAIYYRFEPRRIAKLCDGKLRGPVAIHRSALERIDRRTANYAPGMLPNRFEVTDTPLATPAIPLQITADPEEWQAARKRVDRWVFWRAILYNTFLEVSIWIFVFAIYFISKPPETPELTKNSWQYWVFNAATYALPTSLESLGNALILSVWIPVGLVAVFVIFTSLKKLFRHRELAAREDARKLIRNAWHAARG